MPEDLVLASRKSPVINILLNNPATTYQESLERIVVCLAEMNKQLQRQLMDVMLSTSKFKPVEINGISKIDEYTLPSADINNEAHPIQGGPHFILISTS